MGRLRFQEEYLEWRAVSEHGVLRRVEITTELPDYWRVFAAHHPEETLRELARLAREDTVPSHAVFGDVDPFASAVGPKEREAAFVKHMLRENEDDAPWSPYNSGERAIACMCHGSNTLSALIGLVKGAAVPIQTRDPETKATRPLSGEETIAALGGGFAVPCRNSDPTVVEALVRLATNGHLVALDDPVGIYIVDFKHQRLRVRDGSSGGASVPPSWWKLERGLSAEEGDGFQRFQRLVLSPPEGEDASLEDLIDATDERPLSHAGQVADLVQLAVYARVSAPGVEPPELQTVDPPATLACDGEHPGCEQYRSAWDDLASGG